MNKVILRGIHKLERPSYLTIITIISYAVTLTILFYPTTSEVIMNIALPYRILIIIAFLVAPVLPALFKRISRWIKVRQQYTKAYAKLLEEKTFD